MKTINPPTKHDLRKPQCGPASVAENLRHAGKTARQPLARTARYDFDPCEYVQTLSEIARPRMRVVIYIRESTERQRANLNDQLTRVLKEVRRLGCVVVGEPFQEVRSGKINATQNLAMRRRAAQLAKEHGAVLVFESPSRILRSASYTKHHQHVKPSRQEWEDLCRWLGDVRLASVLPVNATASVEREVQTRRGTDAKNAKPGRPETLTPSQVKYRYAGYACRMHLLLGVSLRSLAKRLSREMRRNVSHTTIQGWAAAIK